MHICLTCLYRELNGRSTHECALIEAIVCTFIHVCTVVEYRILLANYKKYWKTFAVIVCSFCAVVIRTSRNCAMAGILLTSVVKNATFAISYLESYVLDGKGSFLSPSVLVMKMTPENAWITTTIDVWSTCLSVLFLQSAHMCQIPINYLCTGEGILLVSIVPYLWCRTCAHGST